MFSDPDLFDSIFWETLSSYGEPGFYSMVNLTSAWFWPPVSFQLYVSRNVSFSYRSP